MVASLVTAGEAAVSASAIILAFQSFPPAWAEMAENMSIEKKTVEVVIIFLSIFTLKINKINKDWGRSELSFTLRLNQTKVYPQVTTSRWIVHTKLGLYQTKVYPQVTKSK